MMKFANAVPKVEFKFKLNTSYWL